MFCIKCGKALEPTACVCPDCGTKVILPEGFVSESSDTVDMDADMLTGEKTVAADYEAIARKAATSAKSAEPVTLFQEPKFSTGFDLNSAKKIMNGRSILIDDSPAPAAMPSFVAAAPAPVQNGGDPDNAKKNNYAVIIIAAIAVIAVAIGAVFAVRFFKEDEKDDGAKAETTAEATAEESTLYFADNVTQEYFEESTTLGNNAQDIFSEPATNKYPHYQTPENNGNRDDSDKEKTTEDIIDAPTDSSNTQKDETAVITEPSTGIGNTDETPPLITLPATPDFPQI